MNTRTGKIYELNEEQAKEHQKLVEEYKNKYDKISVEGRVIGENELKYPEILADNVPMLVPITEQQMLFFKSKDLAFRSIWGKRIVRGLSEIENKKLNLLMLMEKNK